MWDQNSSCSCKDKQNLIIWLKGNDLPKVISGFSRVIFLATSIGTTFARLQANVNKRVDWIEDKISSYQR